MTFESQSSILNCISLIHLGLEIPMPCLRHSHALSCSMSHISLFFIKKILLRNY